MGAYVVCVCPFRARSQKRLGGFSLNRRSQVGINWGWCPRFRNFEKIQDGWLLDDFRLNRTLYTYIMVMPKAAKGWVLQIHAQRANAGSSDQQTTKFTAEAGPGERGGDSSTIFRQQVRVIYTIVYQWWLSYGHLFFKKIRCQWKIWYLPQVLVSNISWILIHTLKNKVIQETH